MKKVLLWISGIIIFIGLIFGIGYLGVVYKHTAGKANVNADHEVYKQNKAHVEGMIKDLANYKMQYEITDNQKEKIAIKQRIVADFANFNINEIENSGLQQFLCEMRGF